MSLENRLPGDLGRRLACVKVASAKRAASRRNNLGIKVPTVALSTIVVLIPLDTALASPKLAALPPRRNLFAVHERDRGGAPGTDNASWLIFALKFVASHPLDVTLGVDPLVLDFAFKPSTFKL